MRDVECDTSGCFGVEVRSPQGSYVRVVADKGPRRSTAANWLFRTLAETSMMIL